MKHPLRVRYPISDSRLRVNQDLLSGQMAAGNPILAEWRRKSAAPQAPPRYEAHSYCELGLLLEGRQERIYSSGRKITRPGQLWWHGPWEFHGFRQVEENTAFIVQFLPSVIYGFFTGGDFHSFLLQPFLRPEAGAGATGRILAVVEHIHQHLADKLTRPLACRQAGMGRTFFSSTFQQVMGLPFSDYLRQARLERARCELLNTNDKLAVIARRCGFFDQSHFTRQYRAFSGYNPKEERRR